MAGRLSSKRSNKRTVENGVRNMTGGGCQELFLPSKLPVPVLLYHASL